ncbi:unnamed protein product, partial [Trichobilharzia szidati]
MAVPNVTSNTDILKPGAAFKLATYNVRTLMQIGQQARLVRTLESLTIDVCCISETRIQDPSKLSSPSGSSSSMYHLLLSGDPAASASGVAGVGVALSARAEAALLDWIPINSRLCAVRLEGYTKVRSSRPDTRCLFVVSAYAPTDCSPDAMKDEFYHQLNDLLRQA